VLILFIFELAHDIGIHDALAFLGLIIAAPMYVPLLWSLLLIIHSIQLKYRTSLVELLDD